MSRCIRLRLVTAVLTLAMISMGASAGRNEPREGDVHVLIVMPNHYGANYYVLRDILEQYGWRLTTTAVTPTVQPCPSYAAVLGCPPVTVDVLAEDITDVTSYDAVLVMFGSGYVPSPCGDLIGSQDVLDLLGAADEAGLLIGAFCQSVRVLAAAGVIDGVQVTGNPQFRSEYEQAGATYIGPFVPPVLDENILTSTDGLYYGVLICQMVARFIPCTGVIVNGSPSEDVPRVTPRFDRQDRVLWSTAFGGANADGGRSVCPTSDGGYLIVGYTYSFGAGDADIYVIKTDEGGEMEWSKTFGAGCRDYGNAGIEATDGGFVITGYTTLYGGGGENVFVARLDAQGNEEWSTILGGPLADAGAAICEADDGGFVVAGYTFSSGAGLSDVYLTKLDGDGALQWERTFGTVEPEFGMALTATEDGGYAVAGLTGYGPGTGDSDIFLVRTDSDGQELWQRSFGGATYDQGSSIVSMPGGGFVIGGHLDVLFEDCMDAFLTGVDAQGIQEWDARFREGQFYDYGRSLRVTPEGGFMLAGATKNTLTGKNDVYVITATSDGTELWKDIIGGAGVEWGDGVCTTDDGYVITGHVDAEADGAFDVLLLKVSSLTTRFDLMPNTGHAPLHVSFTDQSWGSPSTWQWDFDSDGFTDSQVQHPQFTFEEPGTYSVRLVVANQSRSDSLLLDQCIRVFNGESALRFNGQDGLASCPAASSLNLTDAMTVEAWISPEGWGEVTTTGYGRILDKTNVALYLHGDGTTYDPHSLILLVRNESGPPHVYATPANSLILGGWSHVAASYDGISGHAAIYVNGAAQDLTCSAPAAGPIKDNADIDFLIGNGSSGTYAFDGVVDEVRVWNLIRSPSEITESMIHRLGGSESGLVGYWTMNEGFGTTLEDGSLNGNDATVNGPFWWQGTPFYPTGVEDGDIPGTVAQFALDAAYPNPFEERIMIRYDLPRAGAVDLAIFDVAGRKVRTLIDESRPGGVHHVCWDGRQTDGRLVPSGIYFCRMRCGDFTAARKVLLLR